MLENFNITMEQFFKVNVLGYINELYQYPVKLISLILDLAIVTFIIVMFVLLPMVHFNFRYLLLDGAMFYNHVLCPVLSVITFLCS